LSFAETRFSITKSIKPIIDALSAGYALVLKRIWLIILPIALDTYLWIGPKLSARPLTRWLLSFWLPSEQIPAQIRPFVDANKELLETIGQELDLFSLLSNSLVGIPSYLAGGLPEGVTGSSIVWGQGSSALIVLAAIPLILAAGLFLGSLYLGGIAQIARQDRLDLGYLLRRVWRYWALVLLFGILLLGALFIVGIPAFLIVALLEFFSSSLARLALLAITGLLLWILFHLFFVPYAIVSEDTLLPAIWNSMIVVARNFWAVLFLVVLMNLISSGFSVIWDMASANALLMTISIAGNAFIGTGLIAAALIFYRDRLEQWQAWLDQVQSKKSEKESNSLQEV